MGHIADRTFEDSALKNNRQQGNLLRLQAQFNFRNIQFSIKNIEALSEYLMFFFFHR
jgi:hypothetical protein